jgi:hypothetical protein
MLPWWWIVLAFIVGANFGVIMASIFAAGRE